MFDENRLKHTMQVSNIMEENAKNLGLNPEDMFTLGFLHDIGYKFGDGSNHHIVGAKMLEQQGYKYYKEVRYHGMPTDEYSSIELDLLNFADMQVTRQGKKVSLDKRLDEISARNGEDSIITKNCRQVVDGLYKKYHIIGSKIALRDLKKTAHNTALAHDDNTPSIN